MAKITYEIVQHDGGWAYRVDETFSEAFPFSPTAGRLASVYLQQFCNDPGMVSLRSRNMGQLKKALGKSGPPLNVIARGSGSLT